MSNKRHAFLFKARPSLPGQTLCPGAGNNMPDAIAVPHVEKILACDVQLLAIASVRNEQDASVR